MDVPLGKKTSPFTRTLQAFFSPRFSRYASMPATSQRFLVTRHVDLHFLGGLLQGHCSWSFGLPKLRSIFHLSGLFLVRNPSRFHISGGLIDGTFCDKTAGMHPHLFAMERMVKIPRRPRVPGQKRRSRGPFALMIYCKMGGFQELC